MIARLAIALVLAIGVVPQASAFTDGNGPARAEERKCDGEVPFPRGCKPDAEAAPERKCGGEIPFPRGCKTSETKYKEHIV